MHASWQPGEFNLTFGIGSSFQIETADSSESVGDMNLDDGGIGRFAVYTIHGQFQGARPSIAIHRGNLLLCSCGWWRSLTLEVQVG